MGQALWVVSRPLVGGASFFKLTENGQFFSPFSAKGRRHTRALEDRGVPRAPERRGPRLVHGITGRGHRSRGCRRRSRGGRAAGVGADGGGGGGVDAAVDRDVQLLVVGGGAGGRVRERRQSRQDGLRLAAFGLRKADAALPSTWLTLFTRFSMPLIWAVEPLEAVPVASPTWRRRSETWLRFSP